MKLDSLFGSLDNFFFSLTGTQTQSWRAQGPDETPGKYLENLDPHLFSFAVFYFASISASIGAHWIVSQVGVGVAARRTSVYKNKNHSLFFFSFNNKFLFSNKKRQNGSRHDQDFILFPDAV